MPEERKEFQEMFSELTCMKTGSIYCNGGKTGKPDTDRTGAYGE